MYGVGEMASLRKRKKQETEERILKAARDIFLSEGYAKTTIAKIAEKAGIGVGTFYNYFSTKSQLFLCIFFAQPKELDYTVDSLFNDTPDTDVVETIINFVKVYLNAINNTDKELWKEVMEVFFSDIEEHKKTMGEFIELDFKFIEQLTGIISYYQKKGVLTSTFNPEDAALSIYAICMVQIFMYLFFEQTFDMLKDNVIRQVRLFFSGKYL